jgi:hypothetical protein
MFCCRWVVETETLRTAIRVPPSNNTEPNRNEQRRVSRWQLAVGWRLVVVREACFFKPEDTLSVQRKKKRHCLSFLSQHFEAKEKQSDDKVEKIKNMQNGAAFGLFVSSLLPS